MGKKGTMKMIILIDDDISSLFSLEAMCEELELSYKSFTSSKAAFTFLESNEGTKISLAICDYQMPEMNGLELIKKINSLRRNLPTILITAHDGPEVAISALEIGANDYITKPINFRELAILSKRAIKQKEIKEEYSKLKEKVQSFENSKFNFIGKSKVVVNIKSMLHKIAKTNANILITGETGTGKEIIAKTLHHLSERESKELVNINCASIPANLLESELFGHKKGAFTGADRDKEGLFGEADGGTIFLDEIGDMPLELQAKLLRVLQEGKIRRIGENKERSINVRIIAATHNNLLEKIKAKEFREDLYYRLNVINIQLPPLRDRKEDIPLLSEYFLKKHKNNHGSVSRFLTAEALKKLMEYNWPGNIRELENTIERACILTTDKLVTEKEILITNNENRTDFEDKNFESLPTLEDLERSYISFVLSHSDNVREKAADILQVNRKTLYRKIKTYNLE